MMMFVFKMMNFAFKMMNFDQAYVSGDEVTAARNPHFPLKNLRFKFKKEGSSTDSVNYCRCWWVKSRSRSTRRHSSATGAIFGRFSERFSERFATDLGLC